MRHTRSHTRNRRSHHALTDGAIVKDAASGNLRLPHRVDEATGLYRGMQIANPKVAKAKKSKAERAQHVHEEAAEIEAVAEKADATAKTAKKEVKKGSVLGKVTKARTNSRSGMGGGA